MKLFKIAALSLVMATPLAAQDAPYVHLFSDEGITARLAESGYTDISITREGTKLKINGTVDGASHEMVYDMTTGALVEVDGAGYVIGVPPAIGGTTSADGNAGQKNN